MNHLKIFTILVLMTLCSFSMAQQSDIFLDLEILNANAQVFPVGDLDFTNTGLVQNYFNIRIRNDDANSVTLSLKLEIFYNGVQIASGISSNFTLPANPNFPGLGQEYVLTSQQLSQGNAMINGQSIELSNYEVDWNAVDELENQVLQTGKAPAGTYDFILTGVEPNNPDIVLAPDQNQGNHTVNIANPTYIELLFPGSSVSESTIREIATVFPYFQWQTDVPPTNALYNVFVYQKYPEDATIQDVLNHPPIFHIEGYPNNFLQYPTDTQSSFTEGRVLALRMLEAGKIYYWFVRSIIPSGTGDVTLESDVFRFKIANVEQEVNNAQQILAVLEQILGSRYEQVLSDLREQGFDPNGNFTYDGRNVDINALLELANQIARGEKQIQNVEIY